jgi:hypothetical protein
MQQKNTTDDLQWIRARLDNISDREREVNYNTKQLIDIRELRRNMIVGEETIDSEGFMFSEWEGSFKILTGRKPTDEEFVDYCDWIDKQKKDVNESLYDELKIWFDKRGIPMLPKLREKEQYERI